MKRRRFYFCSTAFIIILGIFSRKIDGIPPFIGDLLYAMMIYSALRMIFLKPLRCTALTALMICFAIEFSQLIRSGWIIEIRKTLFGRYVLGQGFLWGDLLAYSLGVAIALIVDNYWTKKAGNEFSGL
jgi:hypothetical protein